MSQLRVAALASVAVALVLGVGGCSEDAAKPKPLPSSSESQSASSNPASSDTTSGAPSPPNSKMSAEAFARHYIDLINYSSRTGRTVELDAASEESCKSCTAISRTTRKIYSAGGSIRSAGWVIKRITLVKGRSYNQPTFDLRVLQQPQEVVRSSSAPTKRYSGGIQPMAMYIRPVGAGQWKVIRLDLVQ